MIHIHRWSKWIVIEGDRLGGLSGPFGKQYKTCEKCGLVRIRYMTS